MRPEEAKPFEHILKSKQVMVLKRDQTPFQAYSVSTWTLNIKHMLLNALLDLADISFILLKLLSASQAIKHMESCDSKYWVPWGW